MGLRDPQGLDRDDVAAAQCGLLLLQLHRLAHLAGTHERRLLLDDTEQLAHHVKQLFGELARVGRRCDREAGRRRLSGLRMLVHVKSLSISRASPAAGSTCGTLRWKYRRRRPWRRTLNIRPSASNATRRCPPYRRTGLRP